uniref:blue copper protein 1b-like n=1 Tax=Erigeron canadensis TaxID=72917 RepID=UPI001CB95694|nr:blue copper protein 1b-like [Erigeron canadensis]
MALSHLFILFVATLVVLATSVSATEYIVGDVSGWSLDFDYQTWTKDKVFAVGDTLVFNYASGTHNVVKVNGTGFQQCSATSNNGTLTSGRDVIPLLTPGRKWYICSIAKHCELRGMKLAITVLPQTMAPAPSQSASSTLATPTTYACLVAFLSGLALLFV